MLNSNAWHEIHGHFLSESRALLYRSDDCLSHLEMIADDEDAIACLLMTLNKLSDEASHASVQCVADFSRQLRDVLGASIPGEGLSHEALLTLKSCLTLMSWQLELIDLRTGEMPMDSEEQQQLLERLASISGATDPRADCVRG